MASRTVLLIDSCIGFMKEVLKASTMVGTAPAEVHRARNKTELRKYLQEMKEKVKLERKNYWAQWNQSLSYKHLLSENLS